VKNGRPLLSLKHHRIDHQRFGRTIAHPAQGYEKRGERGSEFMLGELIGESKGKRIVRRVISADPPTVEVSFEDNGHLFGVPTTGIGTYTSVVRPDGSIFGEGEGINMTQEGEGISWKGTGLGKFGPGGAVSYRGMLFFQTNSQKISLGSSCGAFEYEVDAAGSTTSKVWEWK
jgi:hypothetical protein